MSSSTNRPIAQPRSRRFANPQAPPITRPARVTTVQDLRLEQMTYEEQQRINNATIKREEDELLIWTALERNESMAQTKLHYDRDMLLIDSDIEEDNPSKDDDANSGSSGSIEWPETLQWNSSDEERMKPGIMYGPDGWWDPKKHKSALERIEEKREKMRLEEARLGKVKVESDDDVSPRALTPKKKKKGAGLRSPGGATPGGRRSSGRRSMGGAGSSA